MKTIKIKINKSLQGYVVGSELTLTVDDFGTPFDNFWRNRLKDSVIDNCIEIIKSTKKSKK